MKLPAFVFALVILSGSLASGQDAAAGESSDVSATASGAETTADKSAAAVGREAAGPHPASKPDKQRLAEEQAIRKCVAAYCEAFNRRDAQALAELWSPEGVYVNPESGDRHTGRESIAAQFARQFEAHGGAATLRVEVRSIRFLTGDVAVEEGVATVSVPGELPTESTYAAVHVKKDGAWRVDNVRETLLPAPESHYAQLKDLEWMVGHWVDEGDDATIHTVCQWTRNRNFITRTFTAIIKDRLDVQGTQVVGWDPSTGQIRSWVFDSNGGFGEGTWRRDGDRWIIKNNMVLSDGRKATTTNVVERLDDNAFTWQSIGREIDGELMPNIDPVTIVRVAAEGEADDHSEEHAHAEDHSDAAAKSAATDEASADTKKEVSP